jgi:hypothetical protein
MLIQTAYNLLPNKSTCNNGQVLYGAALSSMSMALSQLSHVKFLGHANYYVMRSSVIANGGIPNNARIGQSVGRITKGYNETHQFYYASTEISQWLCVLIGYEAGATSANSATGAFAPRIDISLGLLYDSGSGYAKVGGAVDYGIRFDPSDGLQTTSEVNGPLGTYYMADSGINIPSSVPTSTGVEPPRPLYIPATKVLSSVNYTVRGEILTIDVSCQDAKLRSLTVFDIYQSELS